MGRPSEVHRGPRRTSTLPPRSRSCFHQLNPPNTRRSSSPTDCRIGISERPMDRPETISASPRWSRRGPPSSVTCCRFTSIANTSRGPSCGRFCSTTSKRSTTGNDTRPDCNITLRPRFTLPHKAGNFSASWSSVSQQMPRNSVGVGRFELPASCSQSGKSTVLARIVLCRFVSECNDLAGVMGARSGTEQHRTTHPGAPRTDTSLIHRGCLNSRFASTSD